VDLESRRFDMQMITIECHECAQEFSYAYRGGRKRRTCSPECDTARDTRLARYRRRLKASGLDLYPPQLPGFGIPDDELHARVDASREAYWGRRSTTSAGDTDSWQDVQDHDPVDGVPGRSTAAPGIRPSVVAEVAQRASQGDMECKELLAWLCPKDPPAEPRTDPYPLAGARLNKGQLYGLADELATLGYALPELERSQTPARVYDGRGYAMDDAFRTERTGVVDEPTCTLLEQHGFPRQAFEVGRTSPEIRTAIGSDRPYEETWTRPTVPAPKPGRPLPAM